MKIAVFGGLRAGKTSVCDHILSKYKDFEIFDFGDSLKECVAKAYPQNEGQPKNRELLINFGQHLRKFDKDVWVNAVKYKIEVSNSKNLLVTGVRQQNEYEMLKDEGFIFIKIEAGEDIRIQRCIDNGDIFNVESLRDAQTEMVLNDFEYDYLIVNEGSFKKLEIAIDNIMKELVGNELS